MYKRPVSKMICSFQNALKIIFEKKVFVCCLEEKKALGRDEADDGVLITNDSEKANCWMPALLLPPPEIIFKLRWKEEAGGPKEGVNRLYGAL